MKTDILASIDQALQENSPTEFLAQDFLFDEVYWHEALRVRSDLRQEGIYRVGLFQDCEPSYCELEETCSCYAFFVRPADQITWQNTHVSHNCKLYEDCEICVKEFNAPPDQSCQLREVFSWASRPLSYQSATVEQEPGARRIEQALHTIREESASVIRIRAARLEELFGPINLVLG